MTTLKIDYKNLNLDTFYQQLESMKKLGPLKSVMGKLPLGGAKIPDNIINESEGKMKIYKYIIDSCTKEEEQNPEIITGQRIKRISKGSGVQVSEVRQFLKQFMQMKKMMTGTQKGKMPKKFKKMFQDFK
ncbi:MAG: hypothetical protein CVU81_03095 [Euryarchaeota archaeon HGW-Euryarchaeota-1]|nr:MAG: hypothetical protein CVU81_03095 [Euryarchaeota archaeon HGW-Euryarchaeota-1]